MDFELAHSNHTLNGLGIIVGIAIIARWSAWKLKIPAIILLILAGLLVGPVFSITQPKELLGDLFYPLIEVSVAIILFEGGLNLRFHEFKMISSGLQRLISIGIITTWALSTLAAHYIAHLPWSISFILGAILVVTGPTVILPAIRQAKLNQQVSQYLKWEGIINDPLGVLLATLVYEFVIYQGSDSISFILISLLKVLLVSVVLTILFGLILKFFMNKSLIPDFLKVPFMLATVIVLYVISSNIQEGSGLLASTLLGIFFGNQDLKFSTELSRFKEAISIFAISIIFILLSSSLDFMTLQKIDLDLYLFIFLAAFIIRPASLLLCTIGSKMPLKERILVSWFGPRGIVAASMAGILGAKLYLKGYESAEIILPAVFIIVFVSVFVSGMSLQPLADWLKLSIKNSHGVILIGSSPWAIQLATKLNELEIPAMITDSSYKKLIEAKKKNINYHHGEIIVDADNGEVDLTPFSYVFAVTHNDSYNALVCEKLSEDFERNNLFQLPIHESSSAPLEELPESLGGTPLSPNKALYENLIKNYYAGWKFVSTEITESFSYEDLQKRYQAKNSIDLLVLHKDKNLSFLSTDNQVMIDIGDTVISYISS